MRPKGSPQELERRRWRALKLLKQELSLNEVARQIGCNASSVMRWRDMLQQRGEAALKPKPTPGRPPRLNEERKQRLVQCLLQGPMNYGYRTDLWTTLRIAELIEKKFEVRYHRDHIGRLMHDLGWSHQKPERRAIEHDDEAIERWKKKDWPRIKKKPRGWVPTSFLSTNQASF